MSFNTLPETTYQIEVRVVVLEVLLLRRLNSFRSLRKWLAEVDIRRAVALDVLDGPFFKGQTSGETGDAAVDDQL